MKKTKRYEANSLQLMPFITAHQKSFTGQAVKLSTMFLSSIFQYMSFGLSTFTTTKSI